MRGSCNTFARGGRVKNYKNKFLKLVCCMRLRRQSSTINNRRRSTSSSAIAWISKSKSSTQLQLWRILDLEVWSIPVPGSRARPPGKGGGMWEGGAAQSCNYHRCSLFTFQ